MKRMIFVALICALGGTAQADNILLTQFHYSGYAKIKANLESNGHTVDIVDSTTGGSLATALGAETYDQVFLWDLTNASYLNGTDYAAMTSFYNAHQSIVVDSRSYVYNWTPDNVDEQRILTNVASEFASHGGGVWVGTDHHPDWTNNGNPFLTSNGFDPVTGSHDVSMNDYDPASVLLDGVNVASLTPSFISVGHVSQGIQPNTVDMRFHLGHSSAQYGAIPFISASFGTYIAPDEDPDDHNPIVPVPGAFLLGSMGLGFSAYRLKRRKMA